MRDRQSSSMTEKIFLTYSASDTGINYCMGMLTADENSDVLDPLSWKKREIPGSQDQ